MTQYLSRRERREAEARGEITAPSTDAQIAEAQISGAQVAGPGISGAESAGLESRQQVRQENSAPLTSRVESPSNLPYLSRRERRLAEETSEPEVKTPPPPRVLIESMAEITAEVPIARVAESEGDSASFTASNLLAEPKTQSIILDQVPDSLPLTTGEIITTGSIAILSEPIEKVITGALDGAQLDDLASAEAVTGAISIVQPVSALAVIRERESVAVVPSRTLRKGWWQPWLVGLAALIMAGAAIYLGLVVLEAING